MRRTGGGYLVRDGAAKLEIEPGSPCLFTSSARPPARGELRACDRSRRIEQTLIATPRTGTSFISGNVGL